MGVFCVLSVVLGVAVVGCVLTRVYFSLAGSSTTPAVKQGTGVEELRRIAAENRGKRTCVVTGASGFVGGHVVKALAGVFGGEECAPYERIIAVDVRPPSSPGALEGRVGEREVVRASLDIRDGVACAALLEGVESVFHVASVVDTRSGDRQREFLESVNVRGAFTLLEAADRAGVKRFVYTSSVASLLDDKTISEADKLVTLSDKSSVSLWSEEDFTATLEEPLKPIAAYGDTKHRAELQILARANAKGLRGGERESEEGESVMRIIALRPHLLYGEEDAYFTEQVVVASPAAPCTNGGHNRMLVCYGPNLAAYHLQADYALARDHSLSGRAFFVGDELIPVRELYGRLLSCRPTGPQALTSLSVSLLSPLALFSEFLDFLTAGSQRWSLLQLNRNALRYAVGEYPFSTQAAQRELHISPPFSTPEEITTRIRAHYAVKK